MRKAYAFFTILIVALLLAGGYFAMQNKDTTPTPTVTPTSTKPTGWKTYENKEFGFAFEYPGDWETGNEQTNLPSVVVYVVSPEMKKSIEEYPYGGVFGDICFIVQDLNGLSLKSYLEKEQKKKRIGRFSYKEISVNQLPAYEIISGEEGINYEIDFEKNGKRYGIFFQLRDSGNKLTPTERKIVESFRFL